MLKFNPKFKNKIERKNKRKVKFTVFNSDISGM